MPHKTCLLCGGPIHDKNGRKRTLTALGHFITNRCKPTPYAYQYLSALSGEQSVTICISCVNWQRRALGQGRRGKAKLGRPLLFLDYFTFLMLQPGTKIFPDQRCVLRLLKVLKQADPTQTDPVPALLNSLLPVPVQAMVASIDLTSITHIEGQEEGSVIHAVVRAWWDYNGRPRFFAHHLTAKLVRKILKNEIA
jgi:hypothetical protein